LVERVITRSWQMSLLALANQAVRMNAVLVKEDAMEAIPKPVAIMMLILALNGPQAQVVLAILTAAMAVTSAVSSVTLPPALLMHLMLVIMEMFTGMIPAAKEKT